MTNTDKVLVEITKKGAGKIATGQGDNYPQGAIVYMGRAAYEAHSEEGYVTDARPGDTPTYTPKPEGFREIDRLAGVVTQGLIEEQAARQREIDAIPEDVLAKARELLAAEASKKADKAGNSKSGADKGKDA